VTEVGSIALMRSSHGVARKALSSAALSVM